MREKIINTIEEMVVELAKLQSSHEKCREYALAITKLEEAVHWLNH